MKTIWKFPVPINDELQVAMPEGAKILHLGVQGESAEFGMMGMPTIWALVESQAIQDVRRFAWRGTGHNAEGLDYAQYIGTVQFLNGLVFHLFERI